jgi:hypothetical protein
MAGFRKSASVLAEEKASSQSNPQWHQGCYCQETVVADRCTITFPGRKSTMSIITCRSHFSPGTSQVFEGPTCDSFFQYIGGSTGSWRVMEMATISGPSLRPATHVEIVKGQFHRIPLKSAWVLRGLARNTRFFTREERTPLDSRELGLNRKFATSAALIPIRKSAEWWNMAVEDRQEIIEARSMQIRSSLKLLPALVRRLLHGRDFGEPFDEVTWFEYEPKDTKIFDELVSALRSSIEWQYVEREIDIRLVRNSQ